ncbi:preprotein translocase subunit YajC [Prevotella sp. KH2C16]|uniref:preprotein translocase subunit YajC n=1 Tax=Prevotella sp. KH2C16 TaxID=1855325 RepID=UPI0008E37626|nr:preprotein translocase subunit YajC [Prevotella sp. KH2C16]SFG24793.1 preprotein translocase subunit YajC [Prevotella sp. KH2C16]
MTTLILAAQAAQGGGGMGLLIMMIAVFAIMWFFMIRPQQKQQKKIREFQNSLAEGTSVVTGGGIYGTVKHIDIAANKVEIEIARGVVITVNRSSVYADANQQPRT